MTDETSETGPGPVDRELLVRAELALAQLNNRHGLSTEQSATLTAIRLRLEGKERASLDDLLTAGRDLGGPDALTDALGQKRTGPSFDDLVAGGCCCGACLLRPSVHVGELAPHGPQQRLCQLAGDPQVHLYTLPRPYPM